MNIINLYCLNNRFEGAASSLSSRTGCRFEKIYEYKKGDVLLKRPIFTELICTSCFLTVFRTLTRDLMETCCEKASRHD